MCLRDLYVIANDEEEKMALLFEYTIMWWLHLDRVLSVIVFYYIFLYYFFPCQMTDWLTPYDDEAGTYNLAPNGDISLYALGVALVQAVRWLLMCYDVRYTPCSAFFYVSV